MDARVKCMPGDITNGCLGRWTNTCLSPIEFPRSVQTRSLTALIAWMLFLRGDDGVKGGPKGRRRRRSAPLDTIISPKRVLPSDQGRYPPSYESSHKIYGSRIHAYDVSVLSPNRCRRCLRA